MTTKPEKPKPLGSRVFKKHRKMISVIRRVNKLPKLADVVRVAIEEKYERDVVEKKKHA